MTVERLELHAPGVVDAVIALQREAYTIEARLLGVEDLPPLLDGPLDLLRCGEEFLAERDAHGGLAGVVSFRRVDERVEICRLMVARAHFRRGVATRLLAAVAASTPGWTLMRVETGSGNTPALALYAKLGFETVASRPVREGLRVVTLERRA